MIATVLQHGGRMSEAKSCAHAHVQRKSLAFYCVRDHHVQWALEFASSDLTFNYRIFYSPEQSQDICHGVKVNSLQNKTEWRCTTHSYMHFIHATDSGTWSSYICIKELILRIVDVYHYNCRGHGKKQSSWHAWYAIRSVHPYWVRIQRRDATSVRCKEIQKQVLSFFPFRAQPFPKFVNELIW